MKKHNAKKMRRKLRAGDCNLWDLPLEKLSLRQARKLGNLADSIMRCRS